MPQTLPNSIEESNTQLACLHEELRQARLDINKYRIAAQHMLNDAQSEKIHLEEYNQKLKEQIVIHERKINLLIDKISELDNTLNLKNAEIQSAMSALSEREEAVRVAESRIRARERSYDSRVRSTLNY